MTHDRITTRARVMVLLAVALTAGCTSGPPLGAPAPAIDGVDLAGIPVAWSPGDERVLVLDFWAVWCPPCTASGPNVQALHERYEEDPDVVVLAVHYDDADPRDELDEHGYTYRTIPRGGAIASAYGIRQLPTFLVVAPSGAVAFRHVGRLTDDVRDELIRVVEAERAGG